MTTGSLAIIYNILMTKLHYVIPILPFKPQALVFKFTTNVLNETNAYIVLNRWFGVYLM
mgnify:CR=1 FL=1